MEVSEVHPFFTSGEVGIPHKAYQSSSQLSSNVCICMYTKYVYLKQIFKTAAQQAAFSFKLHFSPPDMRSEGEKNLSNKIHCSSLSITKKPCNFILMGFYN